MLSYQDASLQKRVRYGSNYALEFIHHKACIQNKIPPLSPALNTLHIHLEGVMPLPPNDTW